MNIQDRSSPATCSTVVLPSAFDERPAIAIRATTVRQNLLLRSFEVLGLTALLSELELLELHAGDTLCHFGALFDYAYFPTNAIVSLRYLKQDGASTELAVVGCEGAIGLNAYGNGRANATAVVQCSGYGYRITTDSLHRFVRSSPQAVQLAMKYTSALLAQISQNLVSALHCAILPQLARWLLDRLDRLPNEEVNVTHGAIADSLGARRESITSNLGKLQRAGIVSCARSSIVVHDRAALEAIAGSCYFAGRAGYDDLYPPAFGWASSTRQLAS